MMRRLRAYLVTPGAGRLIACLVIALPLLSSGWRMFFGHLPPSAEGPRQISGYYLDGLLFGLLGLLLIAWITSIVSLMARRHIFRGIMRIVATPVIGFVSVVAWSVFSVVVLLTNVCGWPADTVYSRTRDKYYILAVEPPHIDPRYLVFSADGSLLAPVWVWEFPDVMMGWWHNKTQKGRLHLTLSGNEQILAVGRGGQFRYAIAIDEKGDPKRHPIPGLTHDTVSWHRSDDWIRALLAANAEKGAPLVLAPPAPPAPAPGSRLDIQAGTPVAYEHAGAAVAIEGPLADEIIAALNQDPVRAEEGVYMVLYPQTLVRIGGMVFQVAGDELILFDEWGKRVWLLDDVEARLADAAGRTADRPDADDK